MKIRKFVDCYLLSICNFMFVFIVVCRVLSPILVNHVVFMLTCSL